MLVVENLSKSYGDLVALDGVSLGVESGEIVGLLGPNGAGKSTLISIVCGLRRADDGAVEVGGIDALAHPQRAQRLIGLAPQDTGIYPTVSVRQNLQLFAELAGMSAKGVDTRVEDVAKALWLDDLMDRKADELSGGQKRRLHSAIALVNDPPLILLDEASTGADVETRAALLEVVKDLARRGSAVLYSTHYLHEVEALGASIVILEKGAVIARGTVPDMIAGNGGGVIELTFADGPPGSIEGFATTFDGDVVRVHAKDPGRSVARVLALLGPDAGRVEGIEVIRPSLETVYLSLTGKRYQAGEESHVAA